MLKTHISAGARARGLGQLGVTLIELVVTMALLGIFMAMAAPSFSTWLQNGRIRNTATTLSAGIQLAKAEAVARNTGVRFQLTSSLTNDCTITTSGTNWVINMIGANTAEDSVETRCASAPSDTVAPRILHTKPSKDGNGSVEIAATVGSVVFNGLGKPTPAPAANITMDVSNAAAGSCDANGAAVCLRIVITPSGQVRMCNPKLPSTDVQSC